MPVTTKPGAVEIDAAILEPAGGRIGADEQKQIADRAFVFFAGLAVAPAHALETGHRRQVPMTSVCGITSIFGACLDPIDQIARHGGGKAVAAHHDAHLGRMRGQKHRRLARGIAAADQR